MHQLKPRRDCKKFGSSRVGCQEPWRYAPCTLGNSCCSNYFGKYALIQQSSIQRLSKRLLRRAAADTRPNSSLQSPMWMQGSERRQQLSASRADAGDAEVGLLVDFGDRDGQEPLRQHADAAVPMLPFLPRRRLGVPSAVKQERPDACRRRYGRAADGSPDTLLAAG